MDQDRWKTINHIFHTALEVSSSERQTFVVSASNGDLELQAEVEFLLKADQDAGDYLESPLMPGNLPANSDPSLNPGDVLCERFRILRAVGEGGMGHVFEAFDSELAVHVALKIIRPEIAFNPETLNRFRQEVRLARRITHPNVCRTFDLEREARVVDPAGKAKQKVVFLTMEFLDGETLASRINRTGPLPLGEALQVARQVADALTAAHALGIVHRDMKPANIMLSPTKSSVSCSFRAVITDFGLACIDTTLLQGNRSALTHSGRPVGTLSYMAPEQLEGKAVSASTDVYALGLILFEMVTGKRAFPSNNFFSVIGRRLTGPPPSPRALVPSLPIPWCRAIEGCLRLKPEGRFRSADNVIAALDGGRSNLPSVRRPFFVKRRNLIPLRRLIVFAGILSGIMALFLGGYRLYRSSADSKVNPGALVYLTQVQNQTGERDFNNLTELIQAGLAQSVQINLLDQGRIEDTLQKMTKAPDTAIDSVIAREIAMRAGAVRIIFTSVTGSAGSYSLNIDIQQPDNDPARFREHWMKSFAWTSSGSTAVGGVIPQELLSAVRNSSGWIRKKVGESQDDIVRLDVPPEDVTTSKWQALADFVTAKRLIANGHKQDAIPLLQDAVHQDPGFARAYADLGDNLVSMGRREEGYKAYQSALNNDTGERLSRKERDFIKGTYATDTRDYGAALEAFRDYSAFYERDLDGWFYQSVPLGMLDRPFEAIQVLKRANVLGTTAHSIAGQFVYNHLLLGDYSAARGWIEQLVRTGHTDLATYFSGVDAFLEGRYDNSEAAFVRMQTAADYDYRSLGYRFETRLLAEMGQFREALTVASNGLNALSSGANLNDSGLQRLDVSSIECEIGSFSQCIEDLNSALKLNTTPDAVLLASSILGRSFPHLLRADRLRGKALLKAMESSLPEDDLGLVFALARLRLRGELLLAGGNPKEALLAFRKAAALDAPLAPQEYLARGLIGAAACDPNPARALDLRNEALNAYARSATHPAAIWRLAWDYPPGFVGDQMTSYLNLAVTLHRTDSQVRMVQSSLAKMRTTPVAPRVLRSPGTANTQRRPS